MYTSGPSGSEDPPKEFLIARDEEFCENRELSGQDEIYNLGITDELEGVTNEFSGVGKF